LIRNFGNEMKILTEVPIEKLSIIVLPKILEGIKRVREGNLMIEPGFDGQYGTVKIFFDKVEEKQKKLF
jgi:PHP family Zn ribbon phosphoesterase